MRLTAPCGGEFDPSLMGSEAACHRVASGQDAHSPNRRSAQANGRNRRAAARPSQYITPAEPTGRSPVIRPPSRPTLESTVESLLTLIAH